VVSDCLDEVEASLLPVLFLDEGCFHVTVQQETGVFKPLLLNLKSRRDKPLTELFEQRSFVLENFADLAVATERLKYVEDAERVTFLHNFFVHHEAFCKVDDVLVSLQLKEQVESLGDEVNTLFL